MVVLGYGLSDKDRQKALPSGSVGVEVVLYKGELLHSPLAEKGGVYTA